MENSALVSTIPTRTVVRAGIVIALAALMTFLLWQGAENRRRADEIATAEGLVRVASGVFAGKSDLRVGRYSGTLDVTSVNHGKIFDSVQKVIVPYSVDYFVNVGVLNKSRYKWDQSTKSLIIMIDDVDIGEPNIDEANTNVIYTKGIWISREASLNLARRASKLAVQGAATVAKKPENITKARENARAVISKFLKQALQSVNLADITVVVRLPADDGQKRELWDVSPSIEDVLARSRK